MTTEEAGDKREGEEDTEWEPLASHISRMKGPPILYEKGEKSILRFR